MIATAIAIPAAAASVSSILVTLNQNCGSATPNIITIYNASSEAYKIRYFVASTTTTVSLGAIDLQPNDTFPVIVPALPAASEFRFGMRLEHESTYFYEKTFTNCTTVP